MVKACTFDICPRRLAFGLFAGLSSDEWARSRTMGQFPWQSDSGQITGQWQKAIIYRYSRIGKLRASQRVVPNECPMKLIFFFQAEDGIRDSVASRGLGDVYKRQAAKRDH